MKIIRIPPGKSEVLKGPSGSEIVSLPVVVSRLVAGQWELASRENWPCDPRFRKILFAYTVPRSQHLTFHAVREAATTKADSSER
jgi:hypothetical protein